MKKKVIFTNSKGDKLCGILSKAGKDKAPVVVFAHGWTSNKNSATYLLLEKALNENGIDTFRFDLYGHGESQGEIGKMTVSEGVDDLLSAVQYVRKEGYRRIGLFGSSFGGLCSIIASTKTEVIALALKSPVSVYDGDIFDRKTPDFRNDAKIYDGHKAAEKIKCPVLIVHGESDDAVPISQSEKLARLLRNSGLIRVKGLTHNYNEKQLNGMVKNVTKFFSEITKKLK